MKCATDVCVLQLKYCNNLTFSLAVKILLGPVLWVCRYLLWSVYSAVVKVAFKICFWNKFDLNCVYWWIDRNVRATAGKAFVSYLPTLQQPVVRRWKLAVMWMFLFLSILIVTEFKHFLFVFIFFNFTNLQSVLFFFFKFTFLFCITNVLSVFLTFPLREVWHKDHERSPFVKKSFLIPPWRLKHILIGTKLSEILGAWR